MKQADIKRTDGRRYNLRNNFSTLWKFESPNNLGADPASRTRPASWLPERKMKSRHLLRALPCS